MAITKVFRTIGNGFSEEVKEFRSILRRIRLTADTGALGANFRKFGVSFNTYEYDAFVKKARAFFKEAEGSDDPLFTVIDMPGNRIAIDYNGDRRGIFTRKGKPLAFFRPDFRQLGYASKEAELEDFRRGRNVLFG
jgi:pyocin large subunit-like protein